MRFTDKNARDWLLQTGIELASDQLYSDGGKLIWYAKSHTRQIDQQEFVRIIKKELEWEQEDIDHAIFEIKKLLMFT